MSKELEALQRIKKFYPTWHLSNREAFNLVESALKALEIIKEKEVNVKALKYWNKIYDGKLDYQNYLNILEDCDLGERLSQAEFNSLKKEVLS